MFLLTWMSALKCVSSDVQYAISEPSSRPRTFVLRKGALRTHAVRFLGWQMMIWPRCAQQTADSCRLMETNCTCRNLVGFLATNLSMFQVMPQGVVSICCNGTCRKQWEKTEGKKTVSCSKVTEFALLLSMQLLGCTLHLSKPISVCSTG